MRHLYVPLLMVIVSGDMDVNITGYLKGDVLLQCDCKGMKQAKEFKWQIKTNKFFCYSRPDRMSTNCTRHIESFLNDSNDNCSIRLTNITEDDGGTYMCLFTTTTYNRNIFYLEVTRTPPTTGYWKSRPSTEISPSRDHRWIWLTVPAIPLLSGFIWTVLRRRRKNPTQGVVTQEDTQP